jgi:glycosyltransferase involved in cell wall biosynthesis
LRFLAVNKFFYVKGGCERYFFDLDGLLSSHGHEVRHLSMTHPKNRTSPDSKLFVSNVDFAQDESVGQGIKKGLRVIYSREARRAMDNAVREARPDVVHMHNIAHQLSPSIMTPLKSEGIPAVQTLHDYKLICPIYVLMRHGATCEECRGGRFYNAFMRGCHPGGRLAGLANTVEMYLHRSVLRSYDAVRLFLCPSRFMLEKVRDFGVAGDRLVHLPYFIPVDEYAPSSDRDGGYYVFSGRLSREKGLFTLMEAASRVPGMKLVVLGEGPLEGELRGRYGSEPWVEFRGYVSGDELTQVVSGAAFAVVPSEWYENQPLTILESFAWGVPVIASRIGGLPEIVRDGQTGLLVEPGNSEDLASAIEWLGRHPDEAAEMGARARALVESEHSPESHYGRLMEIYDRTLQ